jgi:anti-anti-sigma regulatory factor
MQPLASRPTTLTPPLVKLYIDPSNPTLFARTHIRCAAMRRPRLLIDCAYLPCLRTHGVAHLASHLLLLHQTGAKVLLRNVSPSLLRTLRLLRLDAVFRVYPLGPFSY